MLQSLMANFVFARMARALRSPVICEGRLLGGYSVFCIVRGWQESTSLVPPAPLDKEFLVGSHACRADFIFVEHSLIYANGAYWRAQT